MLTSSLLAFTSFAKDTIDSAINFAFLVHRTLLVPTWNIKCSRSFYLILILILSEVHAVFYTIYLGSRKLPHTGLSFVVYSPSNIQSLIMFNHAVPKHKNFLNVFSICVPTVMSNIITIGTITINIITINRLLQSIKFWVFWCFQGALKWIVRIKWVS